MLNFRYIESGEYTGYISQAIQHLRKYISVPESNILPWQVYTPHDIRLQCANSSYKTSNYNLLPKILF